MADRPTTEVVARPVSSQGDRAYSYFDPARFQSGLEPILESLSAVQPSLRRYAETKRKAEEEALAQEGRQHALAGQDKTSDAYAYVEAYEDIHAKADLVKFQGDLAGMLQQAETEGWDTQTWEENTSNLFANYTTGMPPLWQEKFADPALMLLAKHNGSYKSHLAKQVELELMDKVGQITDAQITSYLSNPGYAVEGYSKDMRKILSDMRGNAKKLKVDPRKISEKFLEISAEKAINEGRPELLEWINEKDASGISLVNTDLGVKAAQYYRQALSAKTQLDNAKASAAKKILEQNTKEINNKLLLMGASIDSRDPKSIVNFKRWVTRYATPNNPEGVMLDPSGVNVLLGYAEKLEKLNGFSDKSDFVSYAAILPKAMRGEMEVADLAKALANLTESDTRALFQMNAEYSNKMQDTTHKRFQDYADQTLGKLDDLVNMKDPVTGNIIDVTNGPKRAAMVQTEWFQWLESYYRDNKYPTIDEMAKKQKELADSAFATYAPLVSIESGGVSRPRTPEEAAERNSQLRKRLLNQKTPKVEKPKTE